jgi:hypothetical protein
MSGDRTPAGNAVAHIQAPARGAPIASICNVQSHWRQERLTEARGVLADIGHHPDTLVILACRVVCECSSDPVERADALGVMRFLNASSPELASATANGGAA